MAERRLQFEMSMLESMPLQADQKREWFLARRLGSVHLASDVAHALCPKIPGDADKGAADV
jgi:hypothetical protein